MAKKSKPKVEIEQEQISWVLADSAVVDPTVDIDRLKALGPFWGSWKTWRAYQTDNVVCHDQSKASELTKRNFQNSCNFYIPNSIYASISRPKDILLYEGAFVHDNDHQEEIVALHLAASTSDIVLLVGFDLAELVPSEDRLATHRAQVYRNHIRQVIKDYNQITWVAIDHPAALDPRLTDLGNITKDNLLTVLSLAGD
jgi:hypothetical protein